jgi:hypothetical protein
MIRERLSALLGGTGKSNSNLPQNEKSITSKKPVTSGEKGDRYIQDPVKKGDLPPTKDEILKSINKSETTQDAAGISTESVKDKTKVEFKLSTTVNEHNSRSILVKSSIGDMQLNVNKSMYMGDWFIQEKSSSGNGLWIKIGTDVAGWQTATIDTPDGNITKRLKKPVIFDSPQYNEGSISNGIDLDVMKSILDERFNPKKEDAESANLQNPPEKSFISSMIDAVFNSNNDGCGSGSSGPKYDKDGYNRGGSGVLYKPGSKAYNEDQVKRGIPGNSDWHKRNMW